MGLVEHKVGGFLNSIRIPNRKAEILFLEELLDRLHLYNLAVPFHCLDKNQHVPMAPVSPARSNSLKRSYMLHESGFARMNQGKWRKKNEKESSP